MPSRRSGSALATFGRNAAIAESRAAQVWVTHGYREELVRWLRERGIDAVAVQTAYTGEAGADAPGPADREAENAGAT